MKTLYTSIVEAHGGRDGHIHSTDGVIDLDLKMPKEAGGPGGHGTNPEQLFAAGYAACFESALRAVARAQGNPVKDAHITAHVALNLEEPRDFSIAVELHGKVDGLTKEQTQALMETAHTVCPYSKATHGNIPVTLIAD